ncbi:hypothetical protein CVD25_10085 [Bacillus canaveralius]|uniref:Uncharacterized protein n=1 Tax=Bacillus canaveralius TaxID=1403243 RepID=A0A2N5GMG6_9BACI|nr:hypothetical protein [Bacillus canaveralius]PLR83014.1 hypothetical protein CU635_11115 [Bacillus canaveralius]PLR96982.1 hypothetical protein CVD25_10085 [Bacillus canaveralius]
MSHTFNTINDRPWLKESHRKRSNRSVEIGIQAIDLLIQNGEPVTYSNIAEISKKIDPKGKGIHPNTIRTNEQLYDYYKQHSLTYKQKENSSNKKSTLNTNSDEFDFRRIKSNRNIDNTHNKYMKLSKKELVQRLILAEKFIVDNQKRWIVNYFEKFK